LTAAKAEKNPKTLSSVPKPMETTHGDRRCHAAPSSTPMTKWDDKQNAAGWSISTKAATQKLLSPSKLPGCPSVDKPAQSVLEKEDPIAV